MSKMPLDARKNRLLRQLLTGNACKIPPRLPASLAGQLQEGGESVFATAIKSATSDQIARAAQITGPLDSRFCVETYKETQDPVWLWLSISLAAKPEEILPDAFQYLRQIAREFFRGVTDQVQSLEKVQIKPGKEFQEGIVHQSGRPPAFPNISDVLGFSQPGRNQFKAAASKLRTFSVTVGVEDLVRRAGLSREEAAAVLAISLGRNSPKVGPSTETIKKMAGKGRKSLRPSRT